MGLLDGKVVVITGAGRGLGRAFAQGAAHAGAQAVIVAELVEEWGRASASALAEAGHEAVYLPLDLEDPGSVGAMAAAVGARYGRIDGLVNNGAIATGIGGKTFEEIDIETWDRVMRVNVRGTWLATRACAPWLRKAAGAAVVNIASDTALWGAPRLLHYVASKGAVIAMTRSLARELGPDGISVNAIAPGLTVTESTEYVPQERHDLYLGGRALRRPQQPEDVVGAVVYLLSSGAHFVTGQLLPVNGGFVLH
jgi:NAD(P)-dependent dehydrogenase (short-subunit alcohol dehydrogenase family)